MKKTLVIMGTHYKGFKFDWKRKDCDLWMFNEAPNVKLNGKAVYPTPDAIFQLHNEAIWKNPKNRSDEKHYEWLKSGKTPNIYMQDKYIDVPKSIKYPLEEVLTLTKNVTVIIDGKQKMFKYFSSSPEYALALAAYMHKQKKGYKRVEIWGIELEHESEYVYQRTGFAFWCGYLAALGIELVLANSIFDSPIYGYERDMAISSKYLKDRITNLTKELGGDKEHYSEQAKTFLDGLNGLLNSDISKDIEKGLNELTKRNEGVGILNGQIKECQTYLERALAMESEANSSVFSMGEFDGARHLHKTEYSNVRNEIINLNSKISLYLKNLLNIKQGSRKRQNAVNEIGSLIAEMMNKNMLLLHLIGAIKEDDFFMESAKLNIKVLRQKNNRRK